MTNTTVRIRRAGFTLIELILTTTVVGIMMSIIVPRMRISETTEVQLAGMQLAQDIDLARTRALSTRNLARVQFTTGTLDKYAGYLDHDGDSTITGSNAELLALRGWQTRDLPARVKYGRGTAPGIPGETGSGAITWSSSQAEFNSRGLVTPQGTGGTVYLTHVNKPGEVVAVSVAPSGSVRLWTYHDGSWK
jgi:prepilin-type N-terminal cleavage/methylation domain-containing protein